MIIIKIGWLLLESALVCLFLYSGNSAVFGFAIALIVIPLISLVFNLFIRKSLQVEIETSGSLRKGDTGSISIYLANPTVFPVVRTCITVEVENQLNRNRSKQRVKTYVRAKNRQRIELNAGDDYCGRIRINVGKVKVYDCFGLIGVPCRAETVGHMTVQPDTFEQNIRIIPNPNAAEDSDIYAPDRPGSDLTEPFQIREYVPGDSPRQIHWKLSGKFDRMIVKDPSMPIIRSVLIFWERTGDSGNAELLDAQAEVMVSLCKNLLEQSVQCTVGWNDTDRNLCILREIHDLDELIGFIPRILRATGRKYGVSGAQLLLNTMGDIPAHVIYVAEEPQSEILDIGDRARVSMLLCGNTPMDGAVMFDDSHYSEQLAQIEI